MNEECNKIFKDRPALCEMGSSRPFTTYRTLNVVSNFGISKKMKEDCSENLNGTSLLAKRKTYVSYSNRTLSFVSNFGISKEMNWGCNGNLKCEAKWKTQSL